MSRGVMYKKRKKLYNQSLLKAMQKEVKFLDTNISSTDITSTGVIVSNCLNAIPVGTGDSQRIGKEVKTLKLMYRGYSRIPNQSSLLRTTVDHRYIVYLDKQANGAAATVTNILSAATWNAFRNLDNTKRFQILYDQNHRIDCTGVGSGPVSGRGEKTIKFFIDIRVPLTFSASTPDVTDMTQNNLGLLVIASDDLGGGSGGDYSLVVGKFRLKYTG